MTQAPPGEKTRAHKGGRKRGPNNAAHPLRLPEALLARIDRLLEAENERRDETGDVRLPRNQLIVMLLIEALTARTESAQIKGKKP